MRTNFKSLLIACFVVSSLVYAALHVYGGRSSAHHSSAAPLNSTFAPPDPESWGAQRHLWVTFTKAHANGGLTYKFDNLVDSVLVHSPGVPLHFNIVTDVESRPVAQSVINKLFKLRHRLGNDTGITYYNVNWCADKIRDVLQCMTPHFSSKPGSYYSDALFYLSIGMHRIAPHGQDHIIILDCDLQFKASIQLLYDEFNKFQSTNLIGLGHELSSVYRRVLYNYRVQHVNTRFGSEINFMEKIRNISEHDELSLNTDNDTDNIHIYNEGNTITDVDTTRSIDSIKGFPGFNSGVILLNLDRLRKSQLYKEIVTCSSVERLTKKYLFKGHLGDQDFFTILGYERPELFHVLDCGWNRQLCKWWRRYENALIFDDYFKCDSPVRIYHGNCNAAIPSE